MRVTAIYVNGEAKLIFVKNEQMAGCPAEVLIATYASLIQQFNALNSNKVQPEQV